jgi:DNA-binding transcriptional ArsR family regulator
MSSVIFRHMAERSAEEPLDLTYAALASPTRRAILELLRDEQARVTDIARAFPASLATVSKHIQVLEHAGLVHREVRGRDHYLRAEPGRLGEAQRWIAEYTGFWERSADALARHVEARAASAAGDAAATGDDDDKEEAAR